ncbi:MAG: CPBP family intramembrane metalloprotease [Clostridia bacterium]|nr:CPBP family intramembrane metalloprotease [Clostridia bacterium]
MKQSRGNNQTNGTALPSLFGEWEPAKDGGLVYSLSAVLPTVIFLLVTIFLPLFGADLENAEGKDWYLYISYLVTPIAFFLIAFWQWRRSGIPVKETAENQRCHWKYFLVAFILQVGLLSFSELNTLFLELLGNFGYVSDPIELPSMNGFGIVGVLLVIALLPAIFEEVIFRGFVLNGLKVFGEAGAILLCGLLFSLYHQNPAQTVYQFFCGAAFALVAVRSGSILPTVFSHFINNALILTLEKFGVTAFPTPVYVTILSVSAVCLLGSLIYLIFVDKKSILEEVKDWEEERTLKRRFFLCAAVGIVVCTVTWVSALFMGI